MLKNTRLSNHLAGALLALTVTATLGISTGCSVYMAAKQADRKDLSVLNPGTPRALVLQELGTPLDSSKHDGNTVDVFAFTQGYSTGAKATRAVFHATADVFTAGLWEVVGTPAEAIFNGNDMKIEVSDHAVDQVDHVRTFGGSEPEIPAAAAPAVRPGVSVPASPSASSGVAPATVASAPVQNAPLDARAFRAKLAASE